MPIYGKAASGLGGDTSWSKGAGAVSQGAAGERRTEKLLNDLAHEYPSLTVMHDIKVPNSRGMKYNIDHAVMADNTVLLVDTKQWKPGFIWTMGGVSRRGFEQFTACDSKSVSMAHADIAHFLPAATLPTPLVVVWPSRKKGNVSLWAAAMPGAKLVHPPALTSAVKRMRKLGEADPALVDALKRHLVRR